MIEPEAKLHILGDDGMANAGDASLYIQSAGNYWSTFWLGDKSHYIKAKPNEDLIFYIEPGDDFVFENGDVGIGVNSPTRTLDDGCLFVFCR